MRLSNAASLFFPVIALIALSSCAADPKVASAPPSREVVAVAAATRENLSRELVLTGEFRPFQEVEVMAKVAGYLKKIYVDVGDRVKEGQLLAVLEIPELGDDIRRAGASVDRSDAEVTRARDEVKRAESSHTMVHLTYQRLSDVAKQRPGLIAQQEIDDAQSKDLASEAGVAAAQSNLNAALQQVSVNKADQSHADTMNRYTQVTAPFAGVVTKRYADTGALIQAGTASQTQAMPVVRISQNSLLRLTLPVPESAVPTVTVGQEVEVKVPTLNRTFRGRVARFSDKLQTATRTMDTEVDVSNPTGILVPGMYAEVSLTTAHEHSVLTVPVAALDQDGKKGSLLIVDSNGRLQRAAVEIGMETADRVEISGGVNEGALVVVGNRSALHAGQQVQPKLTTMTEAGSAH